MIGLPRLRYPEGKVPTTLLAILLGCWNVHGTLFCAQTTIKGRFGHGKDGKGPTAVAVIGALVVGGAVWASFYHPHDTAAQHVDFTAISAPSFNAHCITVMAG
jgi:hypothetical protein